MSVLNLGLYGLGKINSEGYFPLTSNELYLISVLVPDSSVYVFIILSVFVYTVDIGPERRRLAMDRGVKKLKL